MPRSLFFAQEGIGKRPLAAFRKFDRPDTYCKDASRLAFGTLSTPSGTLRIPGSLRRKQKNAMDSFEVNGFRVTLDKEGAEQYSKLTYPVRYGRFSEIETGEYSFQFNLNGEIKYIQGRPGIWPNSNEWLKRTTADDWVYYASGGAYSRIYSLLGEYYLPCFAYPTNTIFKQGPFPAGLVESSLAALSELQARISNSKAKISDERLKEFFKGVTQNNKAYLSVRSQQFLSLIGGRVSVLPPDARHVDYNVIPVILAEGCLYNCGFCMVKSGKKISLRSKDDILSQIKRLKAFYGRDLGNYNAIFLGQHDALYAGRERIEFAAQKAYEIFRFKHSNLKGAHLFLFGSVDSFNNVEETLFSALNKLPFYTYINIGLESFDQKTLNILKKPVRVRAVEKAFFRMLKVNKAYSNIEITANFVDSSDLPGEHQASMVELLRNRMDRFYGKGAIYLSPLTSVTEKVEMQKRFFEIKNMSRLPTYLYLIQRL